MYYLKYRPRTVEEIDNSHIKDTIFKILKSSKIPHAFIFVGQKGTGKTSAARIVAKSVNCLKNKFASIGGSIEPCNKCKNCLSIDSSASIDVIEMDAASNRGIEEMRNLIRESAFMPMNNRHRVFIIDEAHMITSDAFNALLKTLEEPPRSVIFILATTNLEKIPKTIQSRCFIVNFAKAKKVDILRKLKIIVQNERIQIDDELLKLITVHCDNSFRDAIKMLEELVIQNKLSFEEGKKFLGVLGKQSLLEIVGEKNLSAALLWIEEFSQAGGNFKNLMEQLLDELRQLLLAKNKIIPEPEVDVDFSLLEISQLIKLLNEAYNNLKISPIESLPLEIAVADFYNIRKVQK